MTCSGCGNPDAYQVRIYMDRNGKEEICNVCGSLACADAAVPDTYLDHVGQKFENLCDKTGRPYEISSKRHKKEIMDRLGVSEAGDRIHGAPLEPKPWIEGTREYRKRNFENDRPMIRENIRRYLQNVRDNVRGRP